ncbi:MAG: hypothetical protein IPH58_03395 [Sphingobacteriales bacterium]|jgi:hypothetical protein|nr:hypothetical protein [Sphingobacteriales bacterium]
MSNNLNYNINFGVQNENRVIAAVSNVSAGLVNVEKGIFKVGIVFGKVVNSRSSNMRGIQMSSAMMNGQCGIMNFDLCRRKNHPDDYKDNVSHSRHGP